MLLTAAAAVDVQYASFPVIKMYTGSGCYLIVCVADVR